MEFFFQATECSLFLFFSVYNICLWDSCMLAFLKFILGLAGMVLDEHTHTMDIITESFVSLNWFNLIFFSYLDRNYLHIMCFFFYA